VGGKVHHGELRFRRSFFLPLFRFSDPAPRDFSKESGTLISKTSESTSHKGFTSTDRERKEIAFKTQEDQFETALEGRRQIPRCKLPHMGDQQIAPS
jgi:hypothetical protein